MFKSEYEKSKELEIIPNLKPFATSLKANVVNSSNESDRRRYGQMVVDAICKQLKIPSVKLYVLAMPQKHQNTARGRLKSKTLGQYYHHGNVGLKIQIWNFTAKQHKIVSGKTFFGTLLHEICHHIDCAMLGFTNSPHTSGFYKRLSCLESMFS